MKLIITLPIPGKCTGDVAPVKKLARIPIHSCLEFVERNLFSEMPLRCLLWCSPTTELNTLRPFPLRPGRT